MDINQIHKLVFKGSIFFVLLGSILGLSGIWLKDFWEHDISWKMLETCIILFFTCTIAAAITKWLVPRN